MFSADFSILLDDELYIDLIYIYDLYVYTVYQSIYIYITIKA